MHDSIICNDIYRSVEKQENAYPRSGRTGSRTASFAAIWGRILPATDADPGIRSFAIVREKDRWGGEMR